MLNVLYIGSVPVEDSLHGSAVLFRLLIKFPKETISVLELETRSEREQRLLGVRYLNGGIPLVRLLRTRFGPTLVPFYYRSAHTWSLVLQPQIKNRRPHAILTVAHSFGWLTAGSVAARLGIPLHLIIHDDTWNPEYLAPALRARIDDAFGLYYRTASSRFCVSRKMERRYAERYGASGEVLLPLRRPDAIEFPSPPPHVAEPRCALRFIFGGSIVSSWMVDALTNLAQVIAPSGGNLVLYGPMSQHLRGRALLAMSNVRHRGFLPSKDFIARSRADGDVMFLPFSFRGEDKLDLSFPSKLTDYTAIGLPILVQAPSDSTVAEWLNENGRPALLVTEDGPQSLSKAVAILQSDLDLRFSLASKALEAGARSFAHAMVAERFHNAVQQRASANLRLHSLVQP